MDYVKLWQEYSTLTRDFHSVFEFMINQLSINHYRIFISYARDVEQVHRNFNLCVQIFEQGVMKNPSEKNLHKYLEMFRDRMIQRF